MTKGYCELTLNIRYQPIELMSCVIYRFVCVLRSRAQNHFCNRKTNKDFYHSQHFTPSNSTSTATISGRSFARWLTHSLPISMSRRKQCSPLLTRASFNSKTSPWYSITWSLKKRLGFGLRSEYAPSAVAISNSTTPKLYVSTYERHSRINMKAKCGGGRVLW